MFALALLGIFGSSLFISQTILFKKILRTHISTQAGIKMGTLISEYKTKIKQAELAEQPINIASISKEYNNPDMGIIVSGSYVDLPDGSNKKDTKSKTSEPQKSSLFQIKAEATHEFGKEEVKLLLFKPQSEKKES
jgi:hypothetical protein